MNAIIAFDGTTTSTQPLTTVHNSVLPDGWTAARLNHCAFEQQGQDLLLTQDDGSSVLIKGYFLNDATADLHTPDGALFRAEWVERLSTHQDQLAQNATAQTSPIGTVKTLDGTVTVQHADGSQETLKIGDQVFQDDVIETADNGSIGITFADGSDFSLGNDGKMILDEMVYDPSTQEGSGSIDVLGGTFAFISGQIAKTSPDAMKVTTPSATIGFRGTSGSGEVTPSGETSIVLIRDPDGTIGEIFISTPAGVFTLGDVLQGADIGLDPTTPVVVRTLTAEQFMQKYAAVTTNLPTVHSMHQQGQNFLDQAIDPTPQPGEKATDDDGNGKDDGDNPPDDQGDGDGQATGDDPAADDDVSLTGGDEDDIIGTLNPDPMPEDLLQDLLKSLEPVIGPITYEPPPAPDLPDTDDTEQTTPSETSNTIDYAALASGDYEGTSDDDTMAFVNDGTACGTLYGLGGDDTLTGGDGCDTLYGGEGNDTLQDANTSSNAGQSGGADVLYGGAGNDTLTLVSGLNNKFYGGDAAGEDTPSPAGTDTLKFATETGDYVDISLVSSTAKIYDGDGTLTASATISDFDIFYLNNGNDTFVGSTGASQGYTIYGESGNDTIVGSDQADVIDGGTGNDILEGGSGDDRLSGGDGDDTLTANLGSDSVYGDSGNDTVILSAGSHLLDGGDDIDTLIISGILGDTINVNLTSGSENATITRASSTYATTTTITDFEVFEVGIGSGEVIGSSNADTIINSGGTYTINGNDGDDTISLIAGTLTTVSGGNGTDTLSFADATAQVTIDGTNNHAEIVSGATTLGSANYASDFEIFVLSDQADSYSNNDQNATVYAGKGADTLRGGTQTDVMYGGNGNDTFHFHYNDGMINSLSGDAGIDTLKFETYSTKHAEVDLSDSANMVAKIVDGSTPLAQASISEFENYILTDNDDSFIGSDGNDTVEAGAGNDNISTGAGNDIVKAGEGNDSISTGAGNDSIYIESGTDTINAGDDDDVIYWTDGAPQDTSISLSGGNGTDRLVITTQTDGKAYVYANSGTALLSQSNGSDGATANISDFEIFELSDGDDTFTGADIAETIYSGAGNDTLTGNGGADYFMFGLAGDTTSIDPNTPSVIKDLGNDTINDFEVGVDKIGIDTSVFADLTTENIIATSSIASSYGTSEPGIIAYFMDGLTFVYYVPDLSNTSTYYQIARVESVELQTSDFTLYQTTAPSTPNTYAIHCTNIDAATKIGSDGDDSMSYYSDASMSLGTASVHQGTLIGLDGNDTLTGGYSADVIYGGKGNDILADVHTEYNYAANGGLDTIYGGDGNDIITLSDGIETGGDKNYFDGDGYNDVGISGIIEGVDTLQFTEFCDHAVVNINGVEIGSATLYDSGNVIHADAGITNFEVYKLTAGNDTFIGNSDSSKGIEVYGENGNDTIDGGGGNDTLRGGADADTITGGSGNDLIIGGAGDDSLEGGEGTDRLVGGAGHNILNGEGGVGDGPDYFVFNVDYTSLTAGDSNTVQNFESGNDKVALDVAAFGGEIKAGNIIVDTGTALQNDYSGLVSDSSSGAIILLQDAGNTTMYYVSNTSNATTNNYQYATFESATVGVNDVQTYTNESELPAVGYDGVTAA